MKRFHTRCRHCDARQALAQRLDWYVTLPVCRACAGPLRPDTWMNNRNNKALSCRCDGHGPGRNFPHRRGTLWCNYQPNGEWKTLERFTAEAATLEPERFYD